MVHEIVKGESRVVSSRRRSLAADRQPTYGQWLLVVLIVDRTDLVTSNDDEATFAKDNVITPLLRIISRSTRKEKTK